MERTLPPLVKFLGGLKPMLEQIDLELDACLGADDSSCSGGGGGEGKRAKDLRWFVDVVEQIAEGARLCARQLMAGEAKAEVGGAGKEQEEERAAAVGCGGEEITLKIEAGTCARTPASDRTLTLPSSGESEVENSSSRAAAAPAVVGSDDENIRKHSTRRNKAKEKTDEGSPTLKKSKQKKKKVVDEGVVEARLSRDTPEDPKKTNRDLERGQPPEVRTAPSTEKRKNNDGEVGTAPDPDKLTLSSPCYPS